MQNKKEKALALITARGGSKRIPHKNIKEFCGKPIIQYSIEAARKAQIFDEVMVSTEDEAIADLARTYGAQIPFMRSTDTANDFAVTADVIKEVLQMYKEQGREFTYVCCMYPTAPFITPEKLKKAMLLIEEAQANTVIPVVQFSFPPQRAIVKVDGMARMKWPEHMNTRSQDLEPFYHDCGQFYFLNVEHFMKTGAIFTEKTVPLEMSDLEVQDIDNYEDWKIAEMKYRLMLEQESK